MFRAEWKKLLRQRWFLGVALALFILNGALFLYRQQTEHAMWLSATDWYQEYHDQCAQMEPEAAFDWITEESLLLNDLLMVSIALDEGNMELLEILQQGRPNILQQYEASGYDKRLKELEGRMAATGAVSQQMTHLADYPQFLYRIRSNYQRMRENDFYEGRPYARALGEKTLEDFQPLEGIKLELGMEYGVRALLENTSADLLILLLAVCICAMTVMPERGKDLFGLMKSCRHGRARLAAAKLLTAVTAVVLLCLLFYGSLFVMTGHLYGFGPLGRPIQSLELLAGSNRMISVGVFLADTYLRTTLAMAAIVCLLECVLICVKNSLLSLGILAVGGGIFAGLYSRVTVVSPMAWAHFLNPLQWFVRVEGYGSYYAVPIFGQPVNTIVLNLILVCLLLVISAAVGMYLFCARPMSARRIQFGSLERVVGWASERLPYSGHMTLQEWGKQLGKNRLLLLLVLAFAVVWITVEKQPANLSKTDRQYRSYIDMYGGPMTEATMDGLQKEQERLDHLEEELVSMAQRLEAGEISKEQYQAAEMVIQRQLELREPLDRVCAQAQSLLDYEKEHGVSLDLVDEIAGTFLLEQRGYDQRQGGIVMLAIIVLLSGIFPGEQKHQMICLLRCTKSGRRPLFAAKLTLGAALAVLMAGIMYYSRILSVQTLYDFSSWEISVQSFSFARQMGQTMSLRQFLLLGGLLQLVGCCCLTLIFLALTLWMKNRLYAILVGAAVFVLPLLLGWVEVAFPWQYTGNRVFFFPAQMAAEGMWRQGLYLGLAAAAAAIALFFAWNKYNNRQWR